MDEIYWRWMIICYVLLAIISAWPLIRVFLTHPAPVQACPYIDSQPDFSDEAKLRIKANYARICGALGFWQLKAKQNRCVTTYVAFWAIPSSILVPIIAQASDNPGAKLLITVMSAYSAILLVMAQRLKTDVNFRAYREGESAFYDTFRALMDDPKQFGDNEEEQLRRYFQIVQEIRKDVREGELASLAKLEE